MKRMIAVLLLASCATYQDIRDTGQQQTWTSAKAPTEVVRCMRLKLLDGNPYTGQQLPLGEGGEVVVRIGEAGPVVGVAQVRPAATGSAVTAWLTRSSVAPQVFAFFEGC